MSMTFRSEPKSEETVLTLELTNATMETYKRETDEAASEKSNQGSNVAHQDE